MGSDTGPCTASRPTSNSSMLTGLGLGWKRPSVIRLGSSQGGNRLFVEVITNHQGDDLLKWGNPS
jgi:hypothetical protein